MNKIEFFSKLNIGKTIKDTPENYDKLKEPAYILASDRVLHFTNFYGFSYNKINIKNQKTRWGSCSRKKNLNFNYKIALLPKRLSDYIIVHEICHLKEFNHSKKFWNLVSRALPNYLELKKELNSQGLRL